MKRKKSIRPHRWELNRREFLSAITMASGIMTLGLIPDISSARGKLSSGFMEAKPVSPAGSPPFWKLAPTPPMGWNSYDAFGGSVTEEEFLVNAKYIKEKLFSFGWNYVVIDGGWEYPDRSNHPATKSHSNDHQHNRTAEPATMDAFGRFLPAPSRFPSAADGRGFKPIADYVHAMGLKFGIHMMRGIPRQAVAQNTPIEGSPYYANDAADMNSTCSWSRAMWGVDAAKLAGQDYYDSLFRLYAFWDVDFVKVDDLSNPYHAFEVEAVRKALDKCGRSMIFSASPGPTPVKKADHIKSHANMWRISPDFWDSWVALDHMFDLAVDWERIGGPGHWPDADMLPLGHIGFPSEGKSRMTKFTHDEQLTLMSLWALIPSSLMLGGNQPDNDEWTLSLITNREVLAINQDPLGRPGRRVFQKEKTEVWAHNLNDGSQAVGLFNRGSKEASVSANWKDLGLAGKQRVHDLWKHKDLGMFSKMFATDVPPHGVVLIRLWPAS